MPKFKEGTIRIKKCEDCKKVVECELAPDPYAEDVLRDSSLIGKCKPCRFESSANI